VSDLAIRRAKSDDLPAITDLYLEVAEEVVAREPSMRHVPDGAGVERRYGSRIGDPDRAVLVAIVDGSVTAFIDAALQRHEVEAIYHLPGVDVFIEELIVTSAHRRRGVASALVRSLETWAKDVGARSVELDTHVTNAAARSLYGALGYREFGVILVKEI
jgi:GNAT superfamily N-acetyltransferase